MIKDFSRQNLQGRNFKDKDFSGAVFSYADVRGANFTNASLRDANFSYVQAGLKPQTCFYLLILSWLFLISLGFISSASGAYVITVKQNTAIAAIAQLYIADTVGLIIFTLFAIAILSQGLISGVGIVVGTILLGAVVAVILARIEPLLPIAKVGSEIVSAALSEAAAASAIALAAATAEVVVTVAISATAAAVIGVLGMTVALIVAASAAIAAEGLGAGVSSALVTVAGALLSACISWRALAGDRKQSLMLNIAISLTAWCGTRFSNADLTDADFTKAIIKSTDFQRASLTRTCWYKAEKINFALFGDTYLYLKDPQVRNLLLTGEGENQNFDYRDFRGINLSQANLKNTSFLGTNFYQANLQGANLSGAKLVRTQFEQANLTDVILTGACIEDWVITSNTKLNGIICKYIFMRFVDGDKRDQYPPRGEFGQGAFILFIKSILDTLELYHESDINPSAAISVLKSLASDYQETIQINGLQRTDNGAIILKLKISEWANKEEIQKEYYSRYSHNLTLFMQDPHRLLPQDDRQVVTKLTEELEKVKKQHLNYTYNIEKLSIGGDINIQNSGILQNIQDSTISDNLLLQGNNNQLATGQNSAGDMQIKPVLIQLLANIEEIVYSCDLPTASKEVMIKEIRQIMTIASKLRNS